MLTSLLEARLPKSRKTGLSHVEWGGLTDAALPLAIATAVRAGDRPVLAVTENAVQAEKLTRALSFYLGDARLPLLRFPDWETLIYEPLSPHPDIISDRLSILRDLSRLSAGIVIVPITTLMQRLPPRNWLAGQSFSIRTGDRINLAEQKKHLELAGYTKVETVYTHGEYALRGALLDIFPMGTRRPVRIDLLDDEIASLRLFDPESQRTLAQIEHFVYLPAHEIPLTEDGIRQFQNNWDEYLPDYSKDCPLYDNVELGFATPGIEYYLPLFFSETNLLPDYLPENTVALLAGDLQMQAKGFHVNATARYEQISRQDPSYPLLPPHQLFASGDEIFQALNFDRIQTHSCQKKTIANGLNFATRNLPDLAFDLHAIKQATRLTEFLAKRDPEQPVLFCAESPGRRETLMNLLEAEGIHPEPVAHFQNFVQSGLTLGILVAPIDDSLWMQQPDLVVLAEYQLFGTQIVQQRRRRKTQHSRINPEDNIHHLAELRVGDAVVHLEYGIGRYQGLRTLKVKDQSAEFLHLIYADDASLYVPVTALHLISRYTSTDPDLAPLHPLGGSRWTKTRDKAVKKACDLAAELLDIYARRAARTGFAHNQPLPEYEKFAAQFPFEETPDQSAAIEAVLADMCATQPMDRLICGDVGFGKTEVAMRATFMAVMNGKQVAVIVPTTLLAQQHLDNFRDRFAQWPVRIEALSRFRAQRETDQIREQLADGSLDVVIGTHKLLQSNMQFKDLGLVVIDEEHRFGVRQKEALKSLRSEVDILALTATPIPRTLNMAVSGLRDLSIIATAPAKRLSIKTTISPYDTTLIKEAVQRELLRGGQVYYVHNKVTSIERIALELQEMVPAATIAIGHGQMRERELERVMSDFYHKRVHILVCTTIIESGIDIPNANTIIINRADHFGLAQLHQLRGRVGRSHHQAYAYLLTPAVQTLTRDAIQRLEAIEQAGDLGIGFTLATHDLEIRGAGELLGEEQSGEIQAVGFSLYTRMLQRAVHMVKSGQAPNEDSPLDIGFGSEVNMHLPALIPDQYLPDVHIRLVFYKRIAEATGADDLIKLRTEMIDRFGQLPTAAQMLFRVADLRIAAQQAGVSRLVAGAEGGWIEFNSHHQIATDKLVRMVQAKPDEYSFKKTMQLSFQAELEDIETRFAYAKNLLDEVGSCSLAA